MKNNYLKIFSLAFYLQLKNINVNSSINVCEFSNKWRTKFLIYPKKCDNIIVKCIK